MERADASFVAEDAGAVDFDAVHSVGDLDGDGQVDLSFGAIHDGEWWAYVVPGGPREWGHGMPTAELPSIVGGPYAVPIGDTNGDGFDDLAVDTQVMFGSDSLWPAHVRDADVVGPSSYSTLGAVGDTDGDGADDWMVQSPSSSGYMCVFRNPTSGSLVAADADLALTGGPDGQTKFVGCGDVTGDGIADILAFPSNAGPHVWIIAGGTDWPAGTTADAAATATFSRDTDAIVPYALGDIDDDGVSELQLWGSGSELDPDGGPHVFRGGPWIEGVLEMEDADFDDIVIARLGDLNGDGFTEIEIGDMGGTGIWAGTGNWPDAISSAGADVVLDIDPSQVLARVDKGERFGDPNGDGYGDFFLMDPFADVGSFTRAGTIEVVLGANELPAVLDHDDADVRFEGSATDQLLGYTAEASANTAVLDLDGDDYDDLVVGATVHPSFEGELFVFFGQP